MNKRNGLDIAAYAIRAEYVNPYSSEPATTAFEFRNATVRYRDRDFQVGQIVDIQVRGTKIKPGDQDPEILEWVQLYNPANLCVWRSSGFDPKPPSTTLVSGSSQRRPRRTNRPLACEASPRRSAPQLGALVEARGNK